MAATYQLLLDGSPADEAIYSALSSLQVEENADLPDALRLELAVNRSEAGELTHASDPRLGPLKNLAVVAALEDGPDECIFDGYVLSHALHLETGVSDSTLQVYAQDASWLMNLEEKVKEWSDVSDAQVANSIFKTHTITPASDNTAEEGPAHTEDGHTLMQRASDIQFLRMLARRSGKLCRVYCEDTPGSRIGWFAAPRLDGDPVATIVLNDPALRTTDSLELTWDVARPTAVAASQALMTDATPEGVSGDADASGLEPLDDQDLATFAGQAMTVLLTAAVDDGGELKTRARSVLRDAGWFGECEGEGEVTRVGKILRVGDIVQVDGVGSLHSGRYLVWRVHHTITRDAHAIRFRLRRNAIGPSPGGGPGGLFA
jgi:phage protein D